MRFEKDPLTLIGGVRHGRTLGSPVAIEIANTEWPKWQSEISPSPGRTEKLLTKPRPGHADLAAMQKYGFADARDVFERVSVHEAAARVAAGCLAKALPAELGVGVISYVTQMGPVISKSTRRGAVEALACGVPVGLDSQVHWDRKLGRALGAGQQSCAWDNGDRARGPWAQSIRGRRAFVGAEHPWGHDDGDPRGHPPFRHL